MNDNASKNCNLPTCSMSAEISEIKNDLQGVKSDIRDIKNALLGTQFNPIGLIETMVNMKKEIARLKKFKWQVVGISIGVSTVMAIATTITLFFI